MKINNKRKKERKKELKIKIRVKSLGNLRSK